MAKDRIRLNRINSLLKRAEELRADISWSLAEKIAQYLARVEPCSSLVYLFDEVCNQLNDQLRGQLFGESENLMYKSIHKSMVSFQWDWCDIMDSLSPRHLSYPPQELDDYQGQGLDNY